MGEYNDDVLLFGNIVMDNLEGGIKESSVKGVLGAYLNVGNRNCVSIVHRHNGDGITLLLSATRGIWLT